MVIKVSVFRVFGLLLAVLLISLVAFSNTPANEVQGGNNTLGVLASNWEYIALMVSEIAALFSKKYSGIIKTIVHVVKRFAKKKSHSSSV